MTAYASILKMEGPNPLEAVKQTCEGCMWNTTGGISCEAFPLGKPLAILVGAFDHHYHYEDDQVSDDGLVFAPAID
jgi:hypothetical protein